MRPSSSKVAVRPYTLPPTPPLSPVTSEGSYAESLDEHCPPPPSPPAAAVQPTRSSSSNSSQPSFLTVPPPGALVFDQRVHRYPPKPFTRRERARLWYGGLLFETLESWESLLVHLLLILLLSLTYLACSRLFAPSHLARIDARLRWYLTGVASKAAGGLVDASSGLVGVGGGRR